MSPARIGWWWLAFAAFVVVCLISACARQLVPDEAYYWVWSRHLAGGYLDHPPLLAWIIRCSTLFLGQTEFGVRFFAVILSAATLLVLLAVTRTLIPTPHALWWVAALWLCSPLLALLASVMTPDTPAVFFSTCALAAVLMACHTQKPSWWVLFGICTGLACLSKYTAILLPVAVGLALLLTPGARRHLGMYVVAGFIALLVFSPNIIWNVHHEWISYRFQLHHGWADPAAAAQHFNSLLSLATYLGGQALAWTPVLFVVGLLVLAHFWRRVSSLDVTSAILLWSATLPLALFAVASLRTHGEINWPDFAYVPLSLLCVRRLSDDPTRARWLKIGCWAALPFMVVAQLSPLCWGIMPDQVRSHMQSFTDRQFGWREFGHTIGTLAGSATIVSDRHQDAGELSFYVPGQPDVWAVNTGVRITGYDYLDGTPDWRTIDNVLLVSAHPELFAQQHGYVVTGPPRQVVSLSFNPPGAPPRWINHLTHPRSPAP